MRKLPPDLHRKLILSVGTQRGTRPLSPVEVAEALEEEISAGTPPNELAVACHLENATMVSRFRRLLRLAPSVRHLVDWGKNPHGLSFTIASHIARLHDQWAQEQLCSATLEYNFSSSEVQQVLQVMERASLDVDQAVRSVIQLRPQVERHYVFIGAITLDNLRQKLGTMTQAERNHLLREALSASYPELPAWGGSLGADRFSLVGNEEFSNAMSRVNGGFERAVNNCLVQEVLRRDGTSN